MMNRVGGSTKASMNPKYHDQAMRNSRTDDDHPAAQSVPIAGANKTVSPIALAAPAWRRVAVVLLIAVGCIAGWNSRAGAQVAVMVNGEPITALDIAQRQKFTEIATHKPLSRQEAMDELINEKLKLQIAAHYVLEITDKDVNNALEAMAARAGLTTSQFSQALVQAGVSVAALKRKLKADIGWNAIVRGKFQPSLLVGQQDIQAVLQSRKKDDKADVAYMYSLRQILLLAPRGVPDSILDARRKEAEELRTRFQSCEEGIAMARAMKDVTVRDAITRLSGDVPNQQREILDSTPVGHLTPADVTPLGVEMFAVCSKKQTHGDSAAEREVRDQLANQRYEVQSKRYLMQLRRNAMIEVR
jgi:peptidyl-prolyl cis-trans isomerase SurA